MDLVSLWDQLLAKMQGSIGQQNVEIWLRAVKAVQLQGGVILLEVENPYYSDWIGQHYLEQLPSNIGG